MICSLLYWGRGEFALFKHITPNHPLGSDRHGLITTAPTDVLDISHLYLEFLSDSNAVGDSSVGLGFRE